MAAKASHSSHASKASHAKKAHHGVNRHKSHASAKDNRDFKKAMDAHGNKHGNAQKQGSANHSAKGGGNHAQKANGADHGQHGGHNAKANGADHGQHGGHNAKANGANHGRDADNAHKADHSGKHDGSGKAHDAQGKDGNKQTNKHDGSGKAHDAQGQDGNKQAGKHGGADKSHDAKGKNGGKQANKHGAADKSHDTKGKNGGQQTNNIPENQNAQGNNADGGNRQAGGSQRSAQQSQADRAVERSGVLGNIAVMRQRHMEPTPPISEETYNDVNREAGTNFVGFLRDQPRGSAASEYLDLLEANHAYHDRNRNPLGQYVDIRQVNARLGAIRSGPDGDEIEGLETHAYNESLRANTDYHNAAQLAQQYADWLNSREGHTFAQSLSPDEREDGSSRRSDFYQEHRGRISDIRTAAFTHTRAGESGMATAASDVDYRHGLNARGQGAQAARSWGAHSQLEQWDERVGNGDTSYLTQAGQARLDQLNEDHNQALANIMMHAGRNFVRSAEHQPATRRYSRALEAMAYGQSDLPGAEYVNFDAVNRDIHRVLSGADTGAQVEGLRRSAFERAFRGTTGIRDQAIVDSAYDAWRPDTYGNGADVYGLNSGAPINTDGLGDRSANALGVPVQGTDVPALAMEYNRRFTANWLNAGGARDDGLAATQDEWYQLTRMREATPEYLTDEGHDSLNAMDAVGHAYDWEFRPPTPAQIPDWNAEGVRLDDVRRELRRRTGAAFISWLGPDPRSQ